MLLYMTFKVLAVNVSEEMFIPKPNHQEGYEQSFWVDLQWTADQSADVNCDILIYYSFPTVTVFQAVVLNVNIIY